MKRAGSTHAIVHYTFIKSNPIHEKQINNLSKPFKQIESNHQLPQDYNDLLYVTLALDAGEDNQVGRLQLAGACCVCVSQNLVPIPNIWK
jgi:hypothetical protein